MDDYFSVPALSASGINSYLNGSPAHFWKESPFNPNRTSRPETPAMLMGKVAHKLALEHHVFDEEFAVAPECNRRTNEGKAQYAEVAAQAEGKAVITAEIYQEAILLAQAMRNNKAVQKLLGNGMPEKPLMWEVDIACKAKLDYYREGLILDYKTSTSASPVDFTKAIVNYGYHRQAAWYMEGIERVYGERPNGFVFIVQDKSLPEAIGIYSIDQEALEIGAIQNGRATSEIAERLNTENWGAFPEIITPIGLPNWYAR